MKEFLGYSFGGGGTTAPTTTTTAAPDFYLANKFDSGCNFIC